MHMHKEHNGAAPLQKSCNICPFTSHLSDVLKNHIERKHLCIEEEKTFKCNKCDFSAKSKVVLKHHKHLKRGEEASLMCKLCDFKTSNTCSISEESYAGFLSSRLLIEYM